MPMIAKALPELRREDFHALLLGPWIEDEQIDFKVTIPYRDGAGEDPWRNAVPDARRSCRVHEQGTHTARPCREAIAGRDRLGAAM